ncbi:NTP transferase domain-containing protein [Rhodobacter sp. SGA-6-6]|uniref:sugar phosphate nucleotidyltransferase n=1 Tax=Rhodobacter sp. SGA-6-6 TaxID=2710882 RepID=UPI0013E9EFB0|nr:sugar phosphate nucleotidyltransferase [Rhodobacter sp. SGA-6-6]NGM46138.1 NTP transferase domain-containing protein [Rhodobacter sp. SGA-6-6]
MPDTLLPSPTTFCVLLAGGKGTRLHELTHAESKPALPFAGGRLVDFALENAARSGLPQVMAATQYQGEGLASYLQRHWAGRFRQGVQIRDGRRLTPRGYLGTADALRANLAEIGASGAELVLVLSADHVYRMDYRAMIADHLASGRSVTVAADTVSVDRASAFGVLSVDRQGGITAFAEKPAWPVPMPGDPGRALISMGVYVFDRRWLEQALADPDCNDFGHDILPMAVTEGAAQVHRPAEADFYWRDVGTLDGYRLAHLDFLRDEALRPFPLDWRTPPQARLAAARGTVLLPGATLGAGVRLSRCIVAPGAHVPDGLTAGRDPEEDARWFRITPGGTVLITAAMADRWRAAHARRRAVVVWRPCPGLQEA